MFLSMRDSILDFDSKCPSRLLFPAELSVVALGHSGLRVAKGLSH